MFPRISETSCAIPHVCGLHVMGLQAFAGGSAFVGKSEPLGGSQWGGDSNRWGEIE